AGLKLPAEKFVELATESVDFQALINSYHSTLYFQTQQSAACHALHNVEARLCRWLLHASDAVGGNDLELTQEFLSHMMGVRRTSVSVCAHLLQTAGFIRYSRGSVKILNREGLEETACECYAAIHDQYEKVLGEG